MLARPLLSQVLADDALTRGLGDPEARLLVEWLVDRVERLARVTDSASAASEQVRRLCHRGRAISRFVCLWCYLGARGAAIQLAGVERFHWPFPTTAVDPCELMHGILYYESEQMNARPAAAA
jgi:hypothetical protein